MAISKRHAAQFVILAHIVLAMWGIANALTASPERATLHILFGWMGVVTLSVWVLASSRLLTSYPELAKKRDTAWQRRAARIKANGGSYTKAEWHALCQRYDHRCLRCKERNPLTADHVIPVYKGGSSNIDNIQPLCQSCNSWKATRVVDFRPKKAITA